MFFYEIHTQLQFSGQWPENLLGSAFEEKVDLLILDHNSEQLKNLLF